MKKKKLFNRLATCLFLLTAYALIYIPWFISLEKNVTSGYHVIHMALDDYIPFCEYFVIPYYLWYLYMVVGLIIAAMTDRSDFLRSYLFTTLGMTVFLIISTVYPNGHHLRPAVVDGNGFCARLVRFLYSTDTSTNLFPSLHVYNSIAAHIAIINNKKIKSKRHIRYASFITCSLIIISTMVIKQHSLFDVITAFITAGIFYPIAFNVDYRKLHSTILHKKAAWKNEHFKVS